jgi:hypothetical protein
MDKHYLDTIANNYCEAFTKHYPNAMLSVRTTRKQGEQGFHVTIDGNKGPFMTCNDMLEAIDNFNR